MRTCVRCRFFILQKMRLRATRNNLPLAKTVLWCSTKTSASSEIVPYDHFWLRAMESTETSHRTFGAHTSDEMLNLFDI